VGSSGAPRVMHGFLTGLVAAELILAAILLLMFVFDRTLGRDDFSSYFTHHLAVEASSVLSVFITIALFMIVMIKSGVNCEARQARHAIVLEQSLHHLRFKRVKIAEIEPNTEREVEQLSKWLHYTPLSTATSGGGDRRVDSHLRRLQGATYKPRESSTNDSVDVQESAPVDEHEQDYSERNQQAAIIAAADLDVPDDYGQLQSPLYISPSDSETKVEEEDDFSTANTGMKLRTRADALSTLDAAIVELFEAIRLIQSPADLRPTLVGISLRQSVWLGYTATVLTSILYGIVLLVLAIHKQ
jgi:hypothetical protein